MHRQIHPTTTTTVNTRQPQPQPTPDNHNHSQHPTTTTTTNTRQPQPTPNNQQLTTDRKKIQQGQVGRLEASTFNPPLSTRNFPSDSSGKSTVFASFVTILRPTKAPQTDKDSVQTWTWQQQADKTTVIYQSTTYDWQCRSIDRICRIVADSLKLLVGKVSKNTRGGGVFSRQISLKEGIAKCRYLKFFFR